MTRIKKLIKNSNQHRPETACLAASTAPAGGGGRCRGSSHPRLSPQPRACLVIQVTKVLLVTQMLLINTQSFPHMSPGQRGQATRPVRRPVIARTAVPSLPIVTFCSAWITRKCDGAAGPAHWQGQEDRLVGQGVRGPEPLVARSSCRPCPESLSHSQGHMRAWSPRSGCSTLRDIVGSPCRGLFPHLAP